MKFLSLAALLVGVSSASGAAAAVLTITETGVGVGNDFIGAFGPEGNFYQDEPYVLEMTYDTDFGLRLDTNGSLRLSGDGDDSPVRSARFTFLGETRSLDLPIFSGAVQALVFNSGEVNEQVFFNYELATRAMANSGVQERLQGGGLAVDGFQVPQDLATPFTVDYQFSGGPGVYVITAGLTNRTSISLEPGMATFALVGGGNGGGGPISAVPLPGSLSILSIGIAALFGLGGLRRAMSVLPRA